MRKTAKIGTMAGMVAVVLLSSNAWAASNNSHIMVTASIAGKLSQTTHHQVNSLTITEQDVQKGYVDIQTGTVLEVKSNDRSGYLINFEMDGSFIRQAVVKINSRSVVVADGQGFVRQPFPGFAGETLQIGYRLFLDSGAKPGVYAWPLTVAASLQ